MYGVTGVCMVLLLHSVTSTHTGWWRTIKEVEPTGEGTHNKSTTLAVLAHHKATSNPTTPHFSVYTMASEPFWRCTGDNDTMHPCNAYMHNEHELEHTPGYAGIPMPPSEIVHTCIGTTYKMNIAHPGLGSENWYCSSLDHTADWLLKGLSSALPMHVASYS